MKLTVDASPLLVRSAGVKGYLYHWIRALKEAAGDDRVLLYPPMAPPDRLDHENSVAGEWTTRFDLVLLHAARKLPILDLITTDVFHASILTSKPPKKTKLTSTIHDLTSWKTPEFHMASNVSLDRGFAETILNKADGLIAVSEHSRQDAIEVLGVKPERVVTIHSGVAAEYFDAKPTPRAKRYVLSVGTIEPRKNLDRLLDAWGALPKEYRHHWDLVVVGPRGWASDHTAERLKREATWLGYVPEADLPGLTAGADLLAYPSLYEGFGFPAAQAMAAGVPVLTSNCSSLPEVVGPGGLFADPMSVSDLSEKLQTLLDAPDLRAELGKAGRAFANRYRWEICAARSMQFFRSLF